MKTLIFTPSEQIDEERINRNYPIPDAIIYPIDINQKVSEIRKRLDSSLKSINSLGITHILVLSSKLFKLLTKESKVGHSYGSLFQSKYPGYEHIQIAIAPSYQALFKNPQQRSKVTLTVDAILHGEKEYRIVNGYYPETPSEALQAIQELHSHDVLAVDIEGYSLQYTEATVATIAFAWSASDGIAFKTKFNDENIISELAEFFKTYKGKLIFHNSPYDASVLIYELFMKSKLDYENMLNGLDIIYRDCEDTKLMVYLIKNSTADIKLDLKDNILDEYGDYGVDVTDITKLDIADLLQYNLTDSCGTFWLYEKYLKLITETNQLNFYRQKFMKAQKVLTYMEMIGMPMRTNKIAHARTHLEEAIKSQLDIITSHPLITKVELLLRERKIIEDNKTLKKLIRTLKNVKPIPFNPGSGKHLAVLFHDVMELPILDETPTGQPATGEDTIKKLLKYVDDFQVELLQAVIELGKATKILNTFISAFEKAEDRGDNRVYLTGSFNLGGTQSLRLSSSKPNLTNLPSGSIYGKIIKQCFVPPVGKLIASCDYTALEAMVGALLTRDPNLMKIYTDGFDSHCFNTYTYWKNKMPDIKQQMDKSETATKFWRNEDGTVECE